MGGSVLFHQGSKQNHRADYEDNENCKQNLHIFSFKRITGDYIISWVIRQRRYLSTAGCLRVFLGKGREHLQGGIVLILWMKREGYL